jgi:hypothetical protein
LCGTLRPWAPCRAGMSGCPPLGCR